MKFSEEVLPVNARWKEQEEPIGWAGSVQIIYPAGPQSSWLDDVLVPALSVVTESRELVGSDIDCLLILTGKALGLTRIWIAQRTGESTRLRE